MKALLLLIACTAGACPPIQRLPLRDAINASNEWNHGEQHQVVSVGFAGARVTKSMKGYIERGMFLLEEEYNGQPIEVGMLVVFARWDAPLCCHPVIAVSKTHFLCQGINNAYPDGWYPYCRIKFIVRGVIRPE